MRENLDARCQEYIILERVSNCPIVLVISPCRCFLHIFEYLCIQPLAPLHVNTLLDSFSYLGMNSVNFNIKMAMWSWYSKQQCFSKHCHPRGYAVLPSSNKILHRKTAKGAASCLNRIPLCRANSFPFLIHNAATAAFYYQRKR